MKVATSLADADISHKSVVSIGNFDGVHLGHQAILKRVVKRARELRLQAAAMTFSPHPIRFLAPERSPRLISTLEQKIQLIEALGIDLLFIAEFDEAFSRLSPEEFIDKYLVHDFNCHRMCLTGNDTGADNIEILRSQGAQQRFRHRTLYAIGPTQKQHTVLH